MNKENKEIKYLLEMSEEEQLDIYEERFKKYDLQFSNLTYNFQLKDLLEKFEKFKFDYFERILVLAAGGHSCALDAAGHDGLLLLLDNQCDQNQLLRKLRSFLYDMDTFWEDLRCDILLEETFVDDQIDKVFHDSLFD